MALISMVIKEYSFPILIITIYILIFASFDFNKEENSKKILVRELNSMCILNSYLDIKVNFSTTKNTYDENFLEHLDCDKNKIEIEENCIENCLIEFKNG